MCEITKRLFEAISEKFACDTRLKKKFDTCIKNNDGITVGSINIEVRNKLNDFFAELADFINATVAKLIPRGELQAAEIKQGRNVDMGVKQAEIKKGEIFEVYCYNCFSVAFIRVWLEKALFIKKSWISVDVDEIQSSPWFK